jgi:hypothetical protein
MRPALIGEAVRTRRAFRRSGALSPILRFSRIFHIHRASPISGIRIVAPIVLAQYKSNERIGEARTPVCRTSPIVIQLAYKFRCTDRKRKNIQYETTAN